MFDRTKHKVKSAAKAAAFTATAMAFFAVAVAFLTVAAWAVLTLFYPTEIVALIIGSVYLALGMISLGMANLANATSHGSETHEARHDETSHPRPEPQEMQNAILQSFLAGMSAGQGAAASRRQ